ncbi:MAG: VWA domain-containing protein [Pirellulaceae bacterium]
MAENDPLNQPVPQSAASTAPQSTADVEFEPPASGWRGMMRGFGATGISMLVHMVILLALALVTFEEQVQQISQILVVPKPEVEDPPVEVELEPEVEIVQPENVALFTAAPAMGLTSNTPAAVSKPALDQTLVAKANTSKISIDAPTVSMPNSMSLIAAVPDGDVKGEARDIVDTYQQAIDRISQELIWMLDKGPVLAVWCFDQSESMKDDQKEIRERVEGVYQQLGLDDRVSGNSQALLTAVTSYGEQFIDHMGRKPTNDPNLIRKAIDEVPIDTTGKEMMCGAVGTAITTYRSLLRGGRQMALILVTDESGESGNNDAFLEKAIDVAKAARCRVFVLGREAVFGYPYAYISWKHPQTKRVHWLQVDRGPETAFPEQLQTDGFRRRHDAFSSGFGPFEQSRLARETNGVFFMLPSVETNLVGAQKERYELDALRPYRPDLRARIEAFADRKAFPLRTLIWSVIQDLNPHAPGNDKAVELRVEFSINPPEFIQQVRQNQVKAKMHLQYMAAAEKALLDGKKLREQEADPRWQANYDIILAQLIAYQARVYEYGVALEEFIKQPKTAEKMKGGKVFVHWDIRTVAKTRTEEAKPYIERARRLFEEIAVVHPGSPWSARAQWELRRGFGVDVVADYHDPVVEVKNPSPIPKL